MKSYNRLSRTEKYIQALGFTANALRARCNEADRRVLCITGSRQNTNDAAAVVDLAAKLAADGGRVLLIDTFAADGMPKIQHADGYDTARCSLDAQEQIASLLKKERDAYQFILLYLPPVRLYVKALQSAQLCDAALLLERYRYSRHADYEKTVRLLQDAKIPIEGAIACYE